MKNYLNNIVFSCLEAQEAMSAQLDNELDKNQTTRLESHLESCESCNQHFQSLQALNQSLKTELFEPVDTTDLWARIESTIDAEVNAGLDDNTVPPAYQLPANLPRRNFLSMMFATGGVLATGGLVMHHLADDRSGDVSLETVNDFLTYRVSGQKQDILGEDIELVKSWLVTRVEFEIPVISTESTGFELVGGRLCSFLKRRLVSLQYRKNEHALSLYVMAATGLDVPETETHKIGNHSVSAASLKGVTNVIWQTEGLLFAAVSDLDQSQVLDFTSQQIGNVTTG